MAKKKLPKERNLVALALIVHGSGAGCHGDKRKEASRKACRGKVKADD